MAGDEGFEPPILGPEPSALPLGQSPIIMISMESGKVCLGKLRLPTECSYCKQVYNLNSSLATRY